MVALRFVGLCVACVVCLFTVVLLVHCCCGCLLLLFGVCDFGLLFVCM